MLEIIEKIFGDEKVKYFHSSDAHQMECGETYVSYKYYNGQRDRVVISFGSNEYGEVPLKVCSSPEQVEKLVNALIY